MKTNKEIFEEGKNELPPALREFLEMFFKFVPNGNLIDFKRLDSENWIVLYENKENKCTPYIVHRLNAGGLHWGHYETNLACASMDFYELTHVMDLYE